MEKIKTIKVANGFVEGRIINVLGRDIVQFLCIPYCKAPVKELRFQKPQPCESFTDGIINKCEFETCPPQPVTELFDVNIGNEKIWIIKERCDEDSLYLNVWCPLEILTGKGKQAVFVFIYGGGYNSGSSSLDIYNGATLSSHENILVVSFNYRIGMLGFLCLEDRVKGNLGIWDQVLALKWIHENISAFNGDEENITLSGYSAGGASASLHLLIEESWPRFSKIIMQSGVCLVTSEVLPKEELNQRSVVCINQILKRHKFPIEWSSDLSDEDKSSIVKFLQQIDFKTFLTDFKLVEGFFQIPWGPCIDGELIKNKLKPLFMNGNFKKCPTMFQNVANEGSRFIISHFPDISVDNNRMISVEYLYEAMKYYPHFPIRCEDFMIEKIKNEYKIKGERFSINILDKIISDEYFICASIELANIICQYREDVYYLWFDTLSNHDIWPEWCGVLHGEDIFYLFGNTMKPDSHSTDSEKKTSTLLMKQYGSFIKSGNLLNGMSNYNATSKEYNSLENNTWTIRAFSEEQFNKVALWENL